MADARGMRPIAIEFGLHIPEHDYVGIVEDTTFDTLTYKLGGSGGSDVAVVVVTFTDGTKAAISTIERTA